MIEPVIPTFDFWSLATQLLGLSSTLISQESHVGMLIFTGGIFFVIYLMVYIVHVFTRMLMSVLTAGRYRE